MTEGATEGRDGYLDLTQLEQLISLDGTGAVLAGLTTTFLRTGPEHVQALTDASLRGDAEGVRLSAHTLRGSAVSLGGRDLARLAAALEEGARNGEVPDQPAVDELRAALATTVGRLRETVKALRD